MAAIFEAYIFKSIFLNENVSVDAQVLTVSIHKY